METEYPHHEQLSLTNFTAFSNITLDFTSGINVLIGENGTGKTHIMKALYAWQLARHLESNAGPADYASIFARTYGVRDIQELHRIKTKIASVSGKYGDFDWQVGLQNGIAVDNGIRPNPPRPVFIPAMEMMAHARNMNGILRDYADFDRTYFDFVSMVTATPSTSFKHDLILDLKGLSELYSGASEWNEEDQMFYLQDKNRRLPYALVAEGIRKVTGLTRLIENNWLSHGGVLFWDEPEVNLNPRWMGEIVEVLIMLALQGVQIFVATHNYVIIKQIELSLRKHHHNGNHTPQVRYFSLSKSKNISKVMWSDDYSNLEPNPILDQYDLMLAEDLELGSQGF